MVDSKIVETELEKQKLEKKVSNFKICSYCKLDSGDFVSNNEVPYNISCDGRKLNCQ